MAELAFEGVSKVFDDGTKAVDDLDLEVADGELMVLVGPSGSGKSTALRMLAGLEDASEGTIRIGGRVLWRTEEIRDWLNAGAPDRKTWEARRAAAQK